MTLCGSYYSNISTLKSVVLIQTLLRCRSVYLNPQMHTNFWYTFVTSARAHPHCVDSGSHIYKVPHALPRCWYLHSYLMYLYYTHSSAVSTRYYIHALIQSLRVDTHTYILQSILRCQYLHQTVSYKLQPTSVVYSYSADIYGVLIQS